MKLGGIEVILMHSGAERKYVVRYGSRTIVDRNIKAVYEIDEFFFRKAPEEVAVGLRNRIPAHVGNLILMLLRNETFHVGIKIPRQSTSPSSEWRHINCMPRQIPNTG